MKYCTKCGQELNDDALFCSKCGAKVEEAKEEKVTDIFVEKPAEEEEKPAPVEEKPAPVEEKPVVVEEAIKEEPVKAAKPNARVKGPRLSIHEQPIKSFLPAPLALIVCSIAIWIINAVGNTSGIGRVLPLLLFMFLSGFFAVMSMIRAVKTIKRQLYFKAALSFVSFALLVTCFIIDFIYLVQS